MLFKAKNKKSKIETFTINPKSVTIGELYGNSDPNTLEWVDGIFANAIRQFASSAAQNYAENASDAVRSFPLILSLFSINIISSFNPKNNK